MEGTHQVPSEQQYYVSPARPGNFGDHIDFKINLDNWFDENRIHNEENVDLNRTYSYILTGAFAGGIISLGRLYAVAVIGKLNGWTRYDRDTYMEFDVGSLPPGEIIQVVWNGIPVFIRRLTHEELA
jgi:ubiquinol-cytochrome c reductase iron-sulfur subunit